MAAHGLGALHARLLHPPVGGLYGGGDEVAEELPHQDAAVQLGKPQEVQPLLQGQSLEELHFLELLGVEEARPEPVVQVVGGVGDGVGEVHHLGLGGSPAPRRGA